MVSSAEHASVESVPIAHDDGRQRQRPLRSEGDDVTKETAATSAPKSNGLPSTNFSMGNRHMRVGPIQETKKILDAAMQIERDPAEATWWYSHTPITELGGLTSAQLVLEGRFEDVLHFLCSVRQGQRD